MSAARRVVFMSPGWPAASFPNGIVTYIANLRAPLLTHGFASSIFASRCDPGLNDSEVIDMEHHPVGVPGKLVDRVLGRIGTHNVGPLRGALDLRRALRAHGKQHPYDLIELEEAFGTPAALRSFVDVPMIVRLHGPWFLNGPALGVPEDEDFRRRVMFEKWAIMRADAVSSPSQDTLDEVRRYYGLALPDAVVIPNPGPEVPPELCWSSERCEPRTLLFVGRFDRHKGGDVVIDAFAKLAKQHRDIKLLFAGPDQGVETDQGRTYLPQYLDRFVPETDIRSRIEILGRQPSAAVAALRRRAAITMVGSRYETFGLAALEGLAHGTPLVVPNAGGIPEFVIDGQTALVFKAGDPSELAAKVDVLLRDPARARTLAAAARADYQARWTPDVVGRDMAAYYERVIAAH